MFVFLEINTFFRRMNKIKENSSEFPYQKIQAPKTF